MLRRRRYTSRIILLFMAVVMLSLVVMQQGSIIFAAVGPGGGSSGGGGGASTRNGWGWYNFSVNGSPAPRGFRDGQQWATVSQTCRNEGSDRVIAFIILTSAGTNAANGIVYGDYTPARYDALRGYNGNAGGNWLPTATARALFDSLPDKQGYQFGVNAGNNVAWFCYSTDRAPEVYLDAADCSTVWGWAFDPSVPSQSIRADLQVDGVTRIWDYANTSRPDVNAAYGITGNHGFQYDISAWVSDGGSHTVSVYTYNIDSSGIITGGPILIGTRVVSGCINYSLIPRVTASVPSGVQPGDPISFNYTVEKGGSTPSPVVTVAIKRYVINLGQPFNTGVGMLDDVSTNCDARYSATLCTAGSWQLPSQSFAATTTVNPAGSFPAYTPISTAGLAPGTIVCEILAIDPPTQNATPRNRWSIPSCVTIVSKPYFSVYSGDTQAGGVFSVAGVCTASPTSSAIIRGFNKGVGSGLGAGTQIAAIATGAITDFVSGSNKFIPGNLKLLSYANTSGTYGGSYGAEPCLPDYWQPVAEGVAPAPAAGNRTITTTTLNAGQKTDIFVDGDAYISGTGIRYNTGASWVNASSIPYFRLIVKGNIYIANTVTQLDGVYVALPRAGVANSGAIYTCTSGAGVPAAAFVSTSCASKLTINGAFVARYVKFLRLGNTLNAATNTATTRANASEEFVYTPEVWLGTPQYTNVLSSQPYDAFTTLPPVL